jgi:hypothetical protein
MKRCRRCGAEKASSEFPPSAKLRDGLSSWCRACHRAATRRARDRHREKYNATRRMPSEVERHCRRCGGAYRCAPIARTDFCSEVCSVEHERALKRDRWRAGKDSSAEVSRRRAKRAANRQRRQRQIEATTDGITEAELDKLKDEAGRCPRCNVEMTDAPGRAQKTWDHTMPLAAGGCHTRDNIRVICRFCNQTRPHDGSDLVAVAA